MGPVCPLLCPHGSELLKTQSYPCHRKPWSENHEGFFDLSRYLDTRKLSRKDHIHITTPRRASGKDGRRKNPHLSASTNGIRKEKAESWSSSWASWIMTLWPGTSVLHLSLPKDVLRTCSSESPLRSGASLASRVKVVTSVSKTVSWGYDWNYTGCAL